MALRSLRNNGYPQDMATFSSLRTSTQAAVELRLSYLASMNGYPSPALVLGRVYRYLQLTSVNDLKRGIQKLRNITRFAAEVLAAVPQLKTNRFQLDRSAITSYIEMNQGAYNFNDLDANDIDLVTFLVISSESPEASWGLELAETTDKNILISFANLYKSCVENSQFEAVDSGPKKKLKIEPLYSEASPLVYVGTADTLTPLHQVPTMSQTLSGQNSNLTKELAVAMLNDEEAIIRYSDVRLLDHLLSLMMNPNTFELFVPSRTKDDAIANDERVKGLKLFSAYLHSLLLLSHYYRIELFVNTYESLESWLGNFPNLPAEVKKNYEEVVRNYDVFDVKSDVKHLFDLRQIKRDVENTAVVRCFFTELTTTFGLTEVYNTAAKLTIGDPSINITNLATLRDNKFDYLLMTHPVGKYDLTRDVISAIANNHIFAQIMNEAFASLIPVIGRYLMTNTLESLKTWQFRPKLPLHSTIYNTPQYHRSDPHVVKEGSYLRTYNAPTHTHDTEHKLRHQHLYSIISASGLVRDSPSYAMISYDAAKKSRNILGREWRSYYPSCLIYGDRTTDKSVLASSPIMIRQLLEEVSGMHYELILHSFSTYYSREMWATYLSSFALLYYVPTATIDDKLAESSGTESKNRPIAQFAQLVTGLGHPYGDSYEQLAAKQEFQEKDLVKITDSIYIAILKQIPIPGSMMGVSHLSSGRPYYYYGGNGGILKVDKLCIDDALLHLHLRPVIIKHLIVPALFDRLYAYMNDSLLLQTDMALRLAPDTESGVQLGLIEKDWKNDRFSPLIDYIKTPDYYSAPDNHSSIEEESSDLSKIVEDIAKATKAAEADTSLARETEASPELIKSDLKDLHNDSVSK